jgi:hypothetical protein
VLTKHIIVDDDPHKSHVCLEGHPQEVLENNSNLIGNFSIKLSGGQNENVQDVNTGQIKTQFENICRKKLGKIVKELYNLEINNEPEKPLNIELCVDLYQMEDY